MIGKALTKVKGVNEALATACTLDAIEVTTGLPTTLMARALPSVAPEDTATLNATQLGEPLGLSGRATNAIPTKRLPDLQDALNRRIARHHPITSPSPR